MTKTPEKTRGRWRRRKERRENGQPAKLSAHAKKMQRTEVERLQGVVDRCRKRLDDAELKLAIAKGKHKP